MNSFVENQSVKELNTQEMKDINGGIWPVVLPLAIAFAIGMYVGYNDAATK